MRLSSLLEPVLEAGRLAMEIYQRPFQVDTKADSSPVTEADLAVDALLSPIIKDKFPSVPVVTEEQSSSHLSLPEGAPFFLVDPIDGTKEFVKKTGEFTINIALIENGTPVAGIVFAPALGRLFIGDVDVGAIEVDESGNSKPIGCIDTGISDLRAVASKSHMTDETAAFLNAHDINETINAGSSLKFCVLAAGEADIYPRFGPTMEWDTAAGHAVLVAAGGHVLLEDGSALRYGKLGYKNPHFIACSSSARNKCKLCA